MLLNFLKLLKYSTKKTVYFKWYLFDDVDNMYVQLQSRFVQQTYENEKYGTEHY